MNKALIAAAVGLIAGSGITYFLASGGGGETADAASGEKEPLYWVAPMDANYRRDEPGQSPMGMDLIPVYEEDAGGEGAGPGTVRISPDVVNNIGVRTAAVEMGQLQSKIDTVGYVQYNEDELVHINPRIEGWIETLYVTTAGDRVEKGQPLYALYSPELVNAQEEYLQALRQGSQQFIRAAEERLKAWLVSESFIAELRKDRKARQTVVYNAPQSGFVAELNVRQGEFVQPGKVLMSLATLDTVWVEAEVFANQVHLVEVGLPVTMRLDYLPGKMWQGEVDYVYPTLTAETRTLPVRLKFNNENGELKPNMFANLVIQAESPSETILVPREAVIRTGDMDRVVLALGDGQFKSIEVTTGRSDNNSIEILDGVDAGDRIVTSAQFLLDSESSKTSDFKRLHHGEDAEEATAEQVTVEATINDVMSDSRMLNVTHSPIEAWDWPEMTMDFKVEKNVDMSALKAGLEVELDIRKDEDGSYTITRIGASGDASSEQVSAEAIINEVDSDRRTLNVTHSPIKAWGWPEMTMDFNVSKNIEMSALEPGLEVELEIRKEADGSYTITRIDGPGSQAMDMEGMDMPMDSMNADQPEQAGEAQ
jgi:Cu(I)/Ag(I) efflux system membrane fusion protein